jgi:hypothetical protein
VNRRMNVIGRASHIPISFTYANEKDDEVSGLDELLMNKRGEKF